MVETIPQLELKLKRCDIALRLVEAILSHNTNPANLGLTSINSYLDLYQRCHETVLSSEAMRKES